MAGKIWLNVPYAQKDDAEVVPAPDGTVNAWFTNVRTAVTRTTWKRLRTYAFERAGRCCEACGTWGIRPLGAGPSVARTVRVRRGDPDAVPAASGVALCERCHGVAHFGRTASAGFAREAFAHLLRVTGMTVAEATAYVDDARSVTAFRGRLVWELDLSVLARAGITVPACDPGESTGPARRPGVWKPGPDPSPALPRVGGGATGAGVRRVGATAGSGSGVDGRSVGAGVGASGAGARRSRVAVRAAAPAGPGGRRLRVGRVRRRGVPGWWRTRRGGLGSRPRTWTGREESHWGRRRGS